MSNHAEHLWTYQATMLKVVDGDTFDADVDLGFHTKTTQRFRLLGSQVGVDCYEMNDRDLSRRANAREAKRVVEEMLPAGSPIFVLTAKAEKGDPKDGFGRFLAQLVTMDGLNVGDHLLSVGLAVAYVRGY